MSKLAIERTEQIYMNTQAGVTVYKGLNRATGAPLAIKEQVHKNLESANAAISEAIAQSKLDHPNVIKIYECFLEPYENSFKTVLVVELMDHDLMKEIEMRSYYQNYWPEPELLYHIRELINAFSYAQSKEVSHRDIKPQNLFISADRNLIKVGDFGSMTQNVSQRSVVETVVGSPLFFSPEMKTAFAYITSGQQVNFQYDPYRSDVYSFGVTVVFMASLQAPVELLNVATLMAETEKVLARLNGYPAVQRWVTPMLAQNNGERPCFATLAAWMQQEEFSLQSSYLSVQPAGMWQGTANLQDLAQYSQGQLLQTTDSQWGFPPEAEIGAQQPAGYNFE